jgi:hydrophobe/amphiphile efflux-1 (HAE1) family protein
VIWNFCISRPVLTLVVFMAATIFGLFGYTQMPLRENPDVEFPVVSVNVVFSGAEPEVIETEVLDPLEEEINTIEGLKELRSTAREEVGTVTAEFELYRDVDIAAQDVRDRVIRARRDLPDDVEEPIIRKLDPDQQAILWIALTGDERWDAVRLSTHADEVLKERLENLKGAGRIQIGGERRYAVRIELDPELLSAYDLTVREVVDAITANNVDIPTGRVESTAREFLVKTQGQFAGPEPFNDIIVASRPGGPIRLSDVGRAVDGVENDRQIARYQRDTAVGLGVVKRSEANTVALADLVKTKMEELSEDFPAGLVYDIAADDSTYVEQSIKDLLFTIGLTTALVTFVILLFLRTFRGTIIAALSIPASLLIGVAAMNVLGFSINTLTMLGLILAIGIVIDDAIVVLESTYRHLEQGADPKPAARVGTTEVAFPSIANTLSLAAVFIPVAFTSGLIGRYFFEFGITVAATVFASTFTALTLTPMLASRLLSTEQQPGRLSRAMERGFEWLDVVYRRILGAAMRRRLVTMLIALAAFALAAFFFTRLSSEFSPAVDRAEFLVSFEVPEGATIRQTDRYAAELESILEEIPEVDRFFMAIGLSQGAGPGKVNEGIMFVKLTPRGERERHQEQIMQEVRRRFAEIPEGRAFAVTEGAGVAAEGAPLQVVLQSPSIEELGREQERLMGWMRANTRLIGVNSNLKLNKPQVDLAVDRDKATEMGITVTDISEALRFLLGEPDITEIEREAERYEVIPEILGKGTMIPKDLARIYVRNDDGQLISLDNLVSLSESVGPSEIHHFNRIRSATISASTPPGVALGDELAKVTAYMDETLPPGFDYAFTGTTQDFRESFRNLTVTIIFSIVFIFLVLSAQFESFLLPLIILTALPLAGVGAAGALYGLGMPLGIFTFIGLIMLTGMATKNAILMLDYTKVLMARGDSHTEAAVNAARIRFRPVIMTTISTVLGMLPIALGYGAGGEARAPMGVAVAAGLTATTFLTLVVLPVLFTLVMDGIERVFGRRGRDGAAEEEAT